MQLAPLLYTQSAHHFTQTYALGLVHSNQMTAMYMLQQPPCASSSCKASIAHKARESRHYLIDSIAHKARESRCYLIDSVEQTCRQPLKASARTSVSGRCCGSSTLGSLASCKSSCIWLPCTHKHQGLSVTKNSSVCLCLHSATSEHLQCCAVC